jgi:hypothetical protein
MIADKGSEKPQITQIGADAGCYFESKLSK